jgi:hypothetical protein
MDSFGGTVGTDSYNAFNAQTNIHLAVVHDYRRPGQVMSAGQIAAAKTPGTLLQLNWKPAYSWADAAGGNATVNAQIDDMANSIKSLGNHSIILTLFHEPENDVSGGASGCASSIYKGTSGTPADYRAMWANVEARFAADGVTNVSWSMNYMNYVVWDCMVDDLWPGNNLVDWLLFESYTYDGTTFDSNTAPFYNWLTKNSDATHDYLSKPWGLGEFGSRVSSNAGEEQFYSDIKTDIDNNTYPKLKLYSVFDAVGFVGDYRVAYNWQSQSDPTELARFENLWHDPAIQAGDLSVDNGT